MLRLRQPDSAWLIPNADIAVVGDSYAHAVCVLSEQGIPGQLRTYGTVLNLGLSGAGPLQELAMLREYGAPKGPRRVVWILFEGNDLSDLAREAERVIRLADILSLKALRTLSPVEIAFPRGA